MTIMTMALGRAEVGHALGTGAGSRRIYASVAQRLSVLQNPPLA